MFVSFGDRKKQSGTAQDDNHRSIPDRDYRGFLAERLVKSARRHVFEGLNIRTKHGAEKTFHGAPDTKIVE